MPKLQKIITVPDIDWSKYKFLPESRLVQQNNSINDLAQQLINQSKKSSYRVRENDPYIPPQSYQYFFL